MPGSRRRRRRTSTFRLLDIRPSTLVHKSRHRRSRLEPGWIAVFAVVVFALIVTLLYLWYEG